MARILHLKIHFFW